jgi:hypothetical protein
MQANKGEILAKKSIKNTKVKKNSKLINVK